MIIELMLYMTMVSLLFGVAALAIERAFALVSWPRRWLWVAAMLISLAGPAILTLGTHAAHKSSNEALPLATVKPTFQVIPLPSLLGAAQPQRLRSSAGAPVWIRFETSVRWSWAGASILLLGLYCAGALRLIRARRNWPQQAVGKYQVFITNDLGPAVFGFVRPAIIAPRWLLNEPVATLEAALTHEHQHIGARDPALLMGALLMLALTPWNLPLWWQLRRLKLAIEVDCDTRVLRLGVDRRLYADTLLRIVQHAGIMPLGAMAIVGRSSQIEQRIRAMMTERPRHMRLWIAAWAAVAIPLLVGAAQLDPPVPASAPALALALATPRVYLGIVLADLDVNAAATSVIAVRHGAIVASINPGSVAEQAGLKRGDLIIQFADTTITNARTLAAEVARTTPDARVPLVIQRGSATQKLVADFSTAPPPRPASGQVTDSSDWDSLRDSYLPISQPALRDELVRMAQLDALDGLLKQASKAPLPPGTSGFSVGPRAEPGSNEANVRRLRDIIRQYGWPTVSMVGVRGATAAGLIASAARNDPVFQAEVLGLMEPLLRTDEVPAMYYAALFDAVHTPQRFGMQFECLKGFNQPTKPVEDPQHLEERRAALGLTKLPKFCIAPIDAKGSG